MPTLLGLAAAAAAQLLLLLEFADAFYLPGVAPRDFAQGAELQVKVNKLTSIKTLPYEYYSLGYCGPSKIVNSAENLGEVLRGDRIENSVYTFAMREDKTCNVGCKTEKLSEKTAKNFKEKIDEDYHVNMILDNLPVAVTAGNSLDGTAVKLYERGFPVGFKGEDGKYNIYNHLKFIVHYHKDPEQDTSRIVGFEVFPLSVKHTYESWNKDHPKLQTCNPDAKQFVESSKTPQEVEVGQEIIFTYDVKFEDKIALNARLYDMWRCIQAARFRSKSLSGLTPSSRMSV